MEDKASLEKYLTEIDNIESLVKGLASKDENEAQEASKKADDIIAEKEKKKTKKYHPKDNTGVNRTVINQKAFDEMGNQMQPVGPNMQQGINPNMDQASFMAMMEQDAKERKQRKKEQEKEAMVWKEKGNVEFKSGNYEKAVELYSHALTIFKDTTVLWTNRAQAYIKIGEYEKALIDCDWATRVFENCLKAYIHQGRAYLGLKQYDKAVESYERAKQIEPTKEQMINEYIKEVELAQKTEVQEKAAAEFEASGELEAEGLVGVLQKINKADQLPMFYSGGLRILAQSIKSTNERTLFRTQGGLNLMQEHCLIAKCFNASPRSLSEDELDMCSATLHLMGTACTDNEENQKQLLDTPGFCDKVLRFIENNVKQARYVKESAAKLLLSVSETEFGRNKLILNFEVTRLVSCLFHLMKLSGPVGVHAVGLLNNLALHKKFKQKIKEQVNDILPAFEKLMTEGANNPDVLPSCISTMSNMCSDTHLRKSLTDRKQLWLACQLSLEKHISKQKDKVSADIVYSTLGLISNLTFENSSNQGECGLVICKYCCKILSNGTEVRITERVLILLGHLLPNSIEVVKYVCAENMVVKFLEFIKNGLEAQVKSAIKCLCVCTQSEQSARDEVHRFKKGWQLLQNLLKHEDEVVIGNAALCLSHCVQQPAVAAKLTESNIIMDLLVLARDGKKHSVQHNCAILIAKLCQADQRHLEKLREFDGIGILHDVMSHVKE